MLPLETNQRKNTVLSPHLTGEKSSFTAMEDMFSKDLHEIRTWLTRHPHHHPIHNRQRECVPPTSKVSSHFNEMTSSAMGMNWRLYDEIDTSPSTPSSSSILATSVDVRGTRDKVFSMPTHDFLYGLDGGALGFYCSASYSGCSRLQA